MEEALRRAEELKAMSGERKGKGPVAAMATNAVLAGVFFFVLQRYGMKASVEISLMWAAFFAAAAAMLAWKQSV